jgi:hypothetical protein
MFHLLRLNQILLPQRFEGVDGLLFAVLDELHKSEGAAAENAKDGEVLDFKFGGDALELGLDAEHGHLSLEVTALDLHLLQLLRARLPFLNKSLRLRNCS